MVKKNVTDLIRFQQLIQKNYKLTGKKQTKEMILMEKPVTYQISKQRNKSERKKNFVLFGMMTDGNISFLLGKMPKGLSALCQDPCPPPSSITK